MDENETEYLTRFLPLVKQMTGLDAAMVLFDKDGTAVAVEEGSFGKSPFKIGDKIENKNDPVYEAIRTGKGSERKLTREEYGVDMMGRIIPLFKENAVEGVLTCSISTEKDEDVKRQAVVLKDQLTQINEAINSIASSAVELSENLSDIQRVSGQVGGKVSEATSAVSSIQHNASFSNILALNASIEAARAGAAGKGFAVVADEMGKFSKQSGDVAKQINDSLTSMIKGLSKVRKAVEASTEAASSEAAAVEEITATLADVTVQAEKLVSLSTK